MELQTDLLAIPASTEERGGWGLGGEGVGILIPHMPIFANLTIFLKVDLFVYLFVYDSNFGPLITHTRNTLTK